MIFLFGLFLWILSVPVCKEANLEVDRDEKHVVVVFFYYVPSISKSLCKESQFYSLPFGQALATIGDQMS